ncbi:heterokaryon incompatibility protein-domain-containing protein [Apodospora peruviana]|uniref:Heterokaryon incompatibility protein-domain-containing protein n=1 Tax=Apodospora peruviana TaxID=516989 RepID=A0AAE0I5D4_9PEZI|nr:heterokaryon incompatibility protein-domain-containing protein [Apodospora peruviana]
MSQHVTCHDTYRYAPFTKRGSTRLLRLMPHQDKQAPIQCQIVLKEPGQTTHLYEALSYTWGSKDNQNPIYIQSESSGSTGRGHSLLVTANLHAALVHLRDCLLERVLWVDAICINQEDNEEKGHQVQAMARIYVIAACVIVWLGKAADESDEALQVLDEAAENAQEGRQHSPISESSQQAIFTLLERPWFQRVWILQEVATARNVVIKCGLSEIDGYKGMTISEPISLYKLFASVHQIQRGDVVCLLEGASAPSVVRACNGYWSAIRMALPLMVDSGPRMKWSDLLPPSLPLTSGFLLVWDWNTAQSRINGEDYRCFINSLQDGYGEQSRAESFDIASSLWHFGLSLDGMGKYVEAGKNFQQAVDVYGKALDNDPTVGDEAATDDEICLNQALYWRWPEDSNHLPALSWADWAGHEGIMRLLLNSGANINTEGDSGQTPLLLAVSSHHESIVRLLLDRGADINKDDAVETTALIIAAEEAGHEAIVQLLLKEGALVDSKSKFRRTPLSYAAQTGHEAIVRLLLERGAAIETQNTDEGTPLSWAAWKGQEDRCTATTR